MNKKQIITISILILIAITAIIYIVVINSNETEKIVAYTSDEISFKAEYENLNSQKAEDGTNKYIELSISDNNKMKYSNIDEVMNTIKKGTGVIYFGFPTCPWCRTMISSLTKVASEYTELKEILYFDARDIRDTKRIDETGNIVTDKEGTAEYKELLSLLNEYLDEYSGLEDPSIKRLYMPSVVFVRNGKVVGVHTGTLDEQSNVKTPLTEEQINELKDIYTKNLDKVYKDNTLEDLSCDDTKKC